MDIASNVIEVPYKIKFTNKDPVPVDKLVASLLAYEKLIKRVGPFLELACDGLIVDDIDVLVAKIESGSLIQELLVRVIFKNEKNYDQAKEVVAKMFENSPVVQSALCLGVVAYIGFGVHNAMQSKGEAPPTTHIEAQQGAIVQLGGTMNISKEAIDTILNRTTDKAAVTKEAIAAIAPAHLDKEASIEFNDSDSLIMTPEFVRETPTDYEPPELRLDNETLLETEIEIWASDKGSRVKSWAGTVPGKIDKRIKFVLDDAVDPDKLHGKRNIKADIVIMSEFSIAKKEFIPKKIEILKVYQKKPQQMALFPSP